jgi:hypothetical protein
VHRIEWSTRTTTFASVGDRGATRSIGPSASTIIAPRIPLRYRPGSTARGLSMIASREREDTQPGGVRVNTLLASRPPENGAADERAKGQAPGATSPAVNRREAMARSSRSVPDRLFQEEAAFGQIRPCAGAWPPSFASLQDRAAVLRTRNWALPRADSLRRKNRLA